MEKVFKSKGNTTFEKVALSLCLLMFVILVIVGLWGGVIGGFIPLVFVIDNYTKKYIVKENGELWVRSIFGWGQKAVGARCVLYDPHAKGWSWRYRYMIISYKSDLKQGRFPILPADAQGLIAALKEKNPEMEIKYVNIPVK